MGLSDFFKTYAKHARGLLKQHDEERAMALAVGGDFEAVGVLEFCALQQNGLERHHRVVDVGCGSGRLAFQLKDFLQGTYVGMDVVPELFEYAKRICDRPDWEFYAAPGLEIPEPDQSADFVCFFSVFTHLLHEESYRYLRDAHRVLKPNGRVVFSFLDFAVPEHWYIFEATVGDTRPDKHLNQFISKDAIHAWAEHLGFHVLQIDPEGNVSLDRRIVCDDGRIMEGAGLLGQSICVLAKA